MQKHIRRPKLQPGDTALTARACPLYDAVAFEADLKEIITSNGVVHEFVSSDWIEENSLVTIVGGDHWDIGGSRWYVALVGGRLAVVSSSWLKKPSQQRPRTRLDYIRTVRRVFNR